MQSDGNVCKVYCIQLVYYVRVNIATVHLYSQSPTLQLRIISEVHYI